MCLLCEDQSQLLILTHLLIYVSYKSAKREVKISCSTFLSKMEKPKLRGACVFNLKNYTELSPFIDLFNIY